MPGIHHVTAISGAPERNLDFYTRVLGLRLVKKTVNFDDPGTYHLYYGDERGTPGTLWTTFPYKNQGVRIGTKGRGQVTATAFSVPAGALASWVARLAEQGIEATAGTTRFGDPVISLSDRSGLSFELIGNAADARAPWVRAGIDASAALRGIHSVTLTVGSPAETLAFLKRILGFDVVDKADGRVRLGVHGAGPGRVLDVVYPASAPPAVNGLGTVHHVAFAVATPDDQLAIRRELTDMGWGVTEVMDRQYFQSIYFREPGGVLLEVATVPPGFAIDEPVEALGESLKLPPWEEPRRARIESILPRVTRPG
jgi:glyoxalase family protein